MKIINRGEGGLAHYEYVQTSTANGDVEAARRTTVDGGSHGPTRSQIRKSTFCHYYSTVPHRKRNTRFRDTSSQILRGT
jgi:hypothetical protein